MGISITLYNFEKCNNSTKVPPTSTPKAVFSNCELKNGTNMYRPSIVLNLGDSSEINNPAVSWNYVHIPSFGRYYFITDWVWMNGLWVFSATIDVLASWANNIKQSACYILRSETGFDSSLRDGLYSLKTEHHYLTTPFTGEWTPSLTQGMYIVGIINADTNAVGAVSYYAFTPAMFNALKTYLMSNSDDWMESSTIQQSASELSEALLKILANPFQYIASVKWFPFHYTTSAWETPLSDTDFGWWTAYDVECIRLPNAMSSISETVSLPKHPKISERGAYVKHAPFSSYKLFRPPFGVMPLSSDAVASFDKIKLDTTVDMISGVATLQVRGVNSDNTTDSNVILQTEAMMAVDIKLAGMGLSDKSVSGIATYYAEASVANLGQGQTTDRWSNPESMTPADSAFAVLGDSIDAIKGLFSLGAAEIGVKDDIVNIASGLQAGAQTVYSHGSNGTLSVYALPGYVTLDYVEPMEENIHENGRPLCATGVLGNYTGYVRCQAPDIDFACTAKERNMISQFLSSGVYIE